MAARISNVRSSPPGKGSGSVADQIKADANRIEYEVDALGRKIGVRRLDFLSKHRVVCLMGEDSANIAAMGHAVVAASVVEIDGDAVSMPRTRREIEAVMSRLDDEGMTAAFTATSRFALGGGSVESMEESAKN